MSVPTVDEDAWRTLEPGTAHPLQRLRAVRELVDAGINAGVLMAPIVPGFSSSRDKLERTIKAIADHGARFVGCNVMYLQDGTRTHFMKFLEREFPVDACRASRSCTRRNTRRDAYRKEVQGMVRVLQDRYGLDASANERRDEQAPTATRRRPNRSGSPGSRSRFSLVPDPRLAHYQATSPNAIASSADDQLRRRRFDDDLAVVARDRRSASLPSTAR